MKNVCFVNLINSVKAWRLDGKAALDGCELGKPVVDIKDTPGKVILALRIIEGEQTAKIWKSNPIRIDWVIWFCKN
jgi:hypothetical protein